ncbi:preprotein translocase subunit YajC, partial [Tyzzerella sp. OttesenSCG-928-J15]|nr:preprotein translocase subunit YajC [Tyzzerella sp. OttesenSCG-928-J15]
REGLKVGDTVCTTGGLFGKIVEIGDEVFVVEFGTNRGLRVPVLKSDVVIAKDPLVKGAKAEKEEGEN